MKLTLPTSTFAAALAAAAFLTGCGSVGYYPGPVRGGHGPDGRYDQRFGDLRGTVSRVDTRNRVIVVDREESGERYDLRNGDGEDRRQAYLSYDDSTMVSFQGRTFQPEDLEAGDRIAANVDQDDQDGRYGDRLFARDIQVLYDVSSGNGTTRDDDGWDRADRDRDGRGDRADRDDRDDRGDRDERGATDLRGTVRSLDTRNHTLEIDRSGYGQGGGVLRVRYDEDTKVEYQGRRYSPENLERGDVVEIDVRRDGDGNGDGDLLAQQIVVVSNGAGR
jgi:hypothetical protein